MDGLLHMVDNKLMDKLSDETKAQDGFNDDNQPKYTVAMETELFLGDDKESLMGRYKALTNKKYPSQIFSIVGHGYEVIRFNGGEI